MYLPVKKVTRLTVTNDYFWCHSDSESSGTSRQPLSLNFSSVNEPHRESPSLDFIFFTLMKTMTTEADFPDAIDLSHHLSEISKSRGLSPLKGLQKYFGKPGMLSLAGGQIYPSSSPAL